jgi:SAM-dependent methyltransferase
MAPTEIPELSPIDIGRSRLLSAFQSDVLQGHPLPCTAIHPDDYMLRFFMGHHWEHRETAWFDYFRSGWSAARTVHRLLIWHFGETARSIRLLDFASGFGRVTRFLVQHVPPEQIWVSDIFENGVTFQRERFGVQGFRSSAEPDGLVCDERFDCIVASSFFSHLPPATFTPWLKKLTSLLRPGGMLIFSVHGEEEGVPSSSEGLRYEPTSEIGELPGESYGTSWVDEAFVRQAAADAAPGFACIRLPRALWSFQDVYVVGDKTAARKPVVHEPIGYLESAQRSTDSAFISLSGWARDPYGAGFAQMRVRLDGTLVYEGPADLRRDDVGTFFGRPAPFLAGWGCRVAHPAGGTLLGEAMISISAVGQDGTDFPIYLGSVEGTELYVRLRAAQWPVTEPAPVPAAEPAPVEERTSGWHRLMARMPWRAG